LALLGFQGIDLISFADLVGAPESATHHSR
jgi:hypothetical protein